jgi:predicted PurR-regulated permease PerM
MSDALRTLKPWVTFTGSVLVIGVLYWAQTLLIPIALAVLLTFILAQPVTRLQRLIGRVPAVLVVVTLTFAVIAGGVWGLANQATGLAADLPRYRNTILEKIVEVRHVVKPGSVEKVQKTLQEIQAEVEKSDQPRGTTAAPVIVRPEQVASLFGFPSWLGPVSGRLATTGFVITLLIFMLLEREDLRGRLLRLIGHGNLAATTRALDEAGERVSRQLLMQTIVNATYGAAIGVGLYLIGVPYPLLWAVLGAALRFIPYVGPIIGAGAPIVIALAALPGWTKPLWTVAMFIGVELFTNLVLETVLYAGAAGVSQVALLIAVAFWTWLWGPMGLLMATPLTVCLVVLGKHVPGLEFLSTLMADLPPLSPDVAYYQRLLAGDQGEAFDIIERHLKTNPPETLYDAILVPALNYAESDRLEDRLTAEQEALIVDGTRELMSDAMAAAREARPSLTDESGETTVTEDVQPLPKKQSVLAYPASSAADELALHMLGQLLEKTPIAMEVLSSHTLISELITAMQERGCPIVCIADLPPSPPSKTRYLIKKLRIALPDVKIVVGRWAPAPLADEDARSLMEAGATHVALTMSETANQLRQLAELSPQGQPDAQTQTTTPTLVAFS